MAVKKRTEPDWQDLRVFLALGRHGSLSAAARALKVNHATIARRLQSLELTLEMRLVDRRREGYALTAAGTRALAAAREMESSVQTLGRDESSDHSPSGLVRINAPPALSQGFLLSRLAELPRRYRNLDIELATDLRRVSLERHEADIAVRMVRPTDGDIVAKRLVSVAYGFYATAAVRRQVEGGAPPAFIGFDEANAHIPEAAWMAEHHPRARIPFRANNHVAQATAARAHVGLALLPHYLGRSGRGLQLCKVGRLPPDRDIWLVTRRQGRSDLAIRTVKDFLVSLFETERALFEA
ncbi:MAG: LysR family transcriptional regulator [Panacagrimonas sp.]